MTISKLEADRGRFRKGRPKTGGRRKGAPNRATRAVKAFLAALCDAERVQAAVKARILRGDTIAFFRALEHVVGKPRQAVALDQTLVGGLTFRWRDDCRGRRPVSEWSPEDGRMTPRHTEQGLSRMERPVEVHLRGRGGPGSAAESLPEAA
jgi:hypothetical protein